VPDRTPRRGGRWREHRRIVNGVFWRARTGAPWRDLPDEYGIWQTVYARHRRWSGDGTWGRILDGLRTGRDQDEAGDRTAAIDATIVRAHQCAAGARRAPPKDIPPERLAPAQLSSPAHPRGHSMARVTSAGHRHDSPAFEPVMAALRIRRPGPGRPRTRPSRLLGDKAYSNAATRSHLRRRHIKATIPEPADQVRNRRARGSRGGRPPAFDPVSDKDRNVAERAIKKLRGCFRMD